MCAEWREANWANSLLLSEVNGKKVWVYQSVR